MRAENQITRCFSCSERIAEGDRCIESETRKRKPRFQCERCFVMDAYRAYVARGLLSTPLVKEALKARSRYREGQTWVMPCLAEDQYQRVLAEWRILLGRVEEFERLRWYGAGLYRLRMDEEWPSYMGRTGAVEVRCLFELCACRIRLRQGGEELEFVADQFREPWSRLDRDQMGLTEVTRISCTLETGIKMLSQVTVHWPKLVPAAKPEL